MTKIELNDVQAERLERLKQLTGANENAILEEALLAYETAIEEGGPPPQFSEEDLREIQLGLDQLARGEVVPHDQVFDRLRTKLGG